MISNQKKVESSVPVQSRVSVISLARLDEYWEREGVYIRTMSQLISWSIELLCEVLNSNDKLIGTSINIDESWRRMEGRGLFQPSLKGRSMKRMSAALAFENMRREGKDPKFYAEKQYKTLHKKNTVRVPELAQHDFRTIHDVSDDELMEIAQKALSRPRPTVVSEKNEDSESVEEIVNNDGAYQSISKKGMSYKEIEKFDKRDAELLKKQNEEMDKLLGIKRTDGGE